MTDQPDLPPGYPAIEPRAAIGFGATLGPVFIDEASHRMAFRVDESHANPAGLCHGGALAVFADSQLAAISTLAGLSGRHTPTITLALDYISPAPIGALVEMTVTLLRRTSSMLFTQGIMTVGETIVARTNAVYRHYDGRA